jgi:hypothetical protein
MLGALRGGQRKPRRSGDLVGRRIHQRDHIHCSPIARAAGWADRLAARVEQHQVAGLRMNQVHRFHERLVAHEFAEAAET